MEKKQKIYTPMAWRYGITNGFSTLLTTVASTYFLFFMTDAAGVPAAIAATVLTIGSTVDLISVPIVGVVMQKVNLKGGKFRPWLIIGTIGACIGRVLSFTSPGKGEGWGIGAWFLIFYILAYICFNFAYSAYTALLPLLATDPLERQGYSAARVTCNSVGKFLFSLTSVGLIAAFGGEGNEARGYTMLALLIGVLCFIGFFQLWLGVKGIDVVETTSTKGKPAEDQYKASIWEMVKYTLTGPYILYLLGATCKGATYFIVTGLAPYYYTYVAGDKSMLTTYLSLSTFLMIGASFISPYVQKAVKNSKTAYALGLGIYAVCLALAYFLGKTPIMFTILLAAGYIGYAIAHAVESTVYASLVDYTQWKHDRDLKPFMMTLFSLVPKIGTTVGSAVSGFGLVAIGFDKANVTPEAAQGVRVLFSAVPAVLLAIGIVMFILFPLTDDKVREMQAEIKARKAAKEA